MKFVYKINSGYDGFRPAVIPDRLEADGRLALRWDRYIDSVEEGSEVWVYFKGPRLAEGIYARGRVTSIDRAKAQVLIRVDSFATDEPLIAPDEDARIAELVRPKGRLAGSALAAGMRTW